MIEIKLIEKKDNKCSYVLASENIPFKIQTITLTYFIKEKNLFFSNGVKIIGPIEERSIHDIFGVSLSFRYEPEDINIEIYKRSNFQPRQRESQKIIDIVIDNEKTNKELTRKKSKWSFKKLFHIIFDS